MSTSTPGSLVLPARFVLKQQDGWIDESTGESTIKWTDTVTYGANVPGWRDSLRRGESATTTLTGTKSTAHLTSGTFLWTKPYTGIGIQYYWSRLTGYHAIPHGIPTGSPTDVDESRSNAEALGKFLRKATDAVHALQGLVVVGEAAQTYQMFRNPALGLRRSASDFWRLGDRIRKQGFKIPSAQRVKTVTRNLADAWLEAQFGWRPFLRDLQDAGEAYDRIVKKDHFGIRRISAKATVEGVVSDEQGLSAPAGFQYDTYARTTSNSTVVYRGAVRVEALNPAIADATIRGFDPESWLPAVWELIPYSFLIDYFTNIGDIILGLSTLRSRIAWCNRTSIRGYELNSWSKARNIPGWTLETSVPAKFVGTKRLVSRSKYEGTLIPDLHFKIPGSGSLRWLNIAALVASRNSDRKWSYD